MSKPIQSPYVPNDVTLKVKKYASAYADGKLQEEPKLSEEFSKIVSNIQNSPKECYECLHDPMMKEFVKSHSEKISYIAYNYENESIYNLSQLEFVQVEYSFNGQYAVGITSSEHVVLMDIKSKDTEKRFVVLESSASKSEDSESQPPQNQDYQVDDIPDEEPNIAYDPGTVLVNKNLGHPDRDEDQAPPQTVPKVNKPKDIFINFSTDSAFVVVYRNFIAKIYNCKLVFNQKSFSRQNNLDVCFDVNLSDAESEIGKLRFLYFFQPAFDYQRYPSVDVETLVFGFENQTLILFLKKDNGFILKDDFKMTEWYERTLDYSEAGFEGTPVYKEAIAESKGLDFYVNKSNHVYYIKKKGSQKYLMGFKMDWDNPSRSRRFQQKHEYKLNENIDIFPRTFSPDGDSVFAYNRKSCQVLRLKLDTTNQYEEVYSLTGAKKNFKHLAVKDDGKYLLLVDTNYKVDILIKSNSSYTNVASFEAVFALASTEYSKQKERSQKTGIEHDVTNMDFLEDGSGIVSTLGNSVIIWKLDLPHTRYNASVSLRDHFFDANLRQRQDGSYSIAFSIGYLGKVQKIIDFNPETNRGCIVRTLGEEVANDDIDTKVLEGYARRVNNKNLRSVSYGGYNDQIVQLKDFFKSLKDCHFINIPNSEYYFLATLKYYTMSELKAYRKDKFEGMNIWDSDPEWEVDYYNYSESDTYGTINAYPPKDYWHHHFPIFTDQAGKYMAMIFNDQGALVIDLKAEGKPHCKIEEGQYFYFLPNNKVLVVYLSPEVATSYEMNEEPKQCESTMMIKLFDLETKEFVQHSERAIEGSSLDLIDTIVVEKVSYGILLTENKLMMYDVDKHRIVHSISICDPQEKVIVSQQYMTHNILMSPNKQYLAICSIVDCDEISMVTFSKGKLHKQKMEMIPKNDRLNRWCFSHDSKYFLVKAGEGINVYLTGNNCENVGVVPIDDMINKVGKVLAINLWNNSEDLEIVFGYKNFIYFNRVPFYPKTQDLMLPMLYQKLNKYMSSYTSQSQDKIGTNIALLMAQQPAYQRRIDDTYIKILAMVDNAKVLDKYFEYIAEDSHAVFKYKSFASIILMQIPQIVDGKKVQVEKMHKNTANSYIDLMEDCIIKDNKFPDVDRGVIESWLQSEKLDIIHQRKLMKLITFEPIPTKLSGVLKRTNRFAVSLKKVKQTSAEVEDDKKEAIAINKAIDNLVNKYSTTQVDFKCFKTSISFDLSNGSEFSLRYFRWLSESAEEDLVELYKPIIYYKWNKVYWPALVYSCVFWILNVLYVAFMGFDFHNLGLMIAILVLNGLFILYEIKCFSLTFRDSYLDLWNYYDVLIHAFSIFSVVYVYNISEDDVQPYKYSWFRLIAFVMISLRAFIMLRVFKPTRYLIVMLIQVFIDMRSYLAVFTYIIFIYWFVCLVRPGLVIDGEKDIEFFTAIKEATNIAFDNFDAEVESVMVFVTTIVGQLVLSLVLLNYLIAIVNSTYSKIAENHDLHNLKMLIDIIREFDCFFSLKRKFQLQHSEEIFFVVPKRETSDTLADLRVAFQTLRSETKTSMEKSLEAHKTQVEATLESIFKRWIPPLTKQVGVLTTNVNTLEEQFNKQKKDMEEARRREREEEAIKKRQMEEEFRRKRDEMIAEMRAKIEKEHQEKLEQERKELREKMEAAARKEEEIQEALKNMEKEAVKQVREELKEKAKEENIDLDMSRQSSLEMSVLGDGESEVEEEEKFEESIEHSRREQEEEEYDEDGECDVNFFD